MSNFNVGDKIQVTVSLGSPYPRRGWIGVINNIDTAYEGAMYRHWVTYKEESVYFYQKEIKLLLPKNTRELI